MSTSSGSSIISYLMGQSLFSSELQSLGMALQANIIVQSRYSNHNTNHQKESSSQYWFYRFLQSVLLGYSGGIFGTIFLGKPCPFLLNDIHMTSCLLAFVLVQILIPNIQRLFRSIFHAESSSSSSIIHSAIIIPIQMVITLYAQLFRSMGLMKFITVCHMELLLPPYHSISTKYYNMPIFGPIVYGTLLGNMGGFILNGIDGYTQRTGIPYPFQNGIFCGTFYHFYVHDTTGIIGTTLRNYLQPLASSVLELLGWYDDSQSKNNEVFATVMVSLFMQIVAILQMPIFYGPTFSPFVVIYNQLGRFLSPFPDQEIENSQSGSPVKTTTNGKNNTKKKENTPRKAPSAAKATSAKDKKL